MATSGGAKPKAKAGAKGVQMKPKLQVAAGGKKAGTVGSGAAPLPKSMTIKPSQQPVTIKPFTLPPGTEMKIQFTSKPGAATAPAGKAARGRGGGRGGAARAPAKPATGGRGGGRGTGARAQAAKKQQASARAAQVASKRGTAAGAGGGRGGAKAQGATGRGRG